LELRQGWAFQERLQGREKKNNKENNDSDVQSKKYSHEDGGYALHIWKPMHAKVRA